MAVTIPTDRPDAPLPISITVTVPYTGHVPHTAGATVIAALWHALETAEIDGIDPQHATVTATDAAPPAISLELVEAIGPHQLNQISDTLVTVTYPVGQATVLSIQPGGTIDTRPAGTAGPYELARNLGDRLVYAPTGSGGKVWIVPLAPQIPNA